MVAGIIDSVNNTRFWEESIGEAFECVLTADAAGLPDCDIILVSEEYCSGSVGSVISGIRSSERLRRIPAAAVTADTSGENQEILLAMGFDDIIRLPLCGQLLLRRVRALNALPPREDSDGEVSFEKLLSMRDRDTGAFCVRSKDFANIFRFVMRILERTGRSAQMLVMSLSCDSSRSPASRQKVMHTLSEAVRLCLRRGDMASVCGDDSVMVLLIGADDDGGHLVASRIVSSFYSECDDGAFELSYDIKEVGSKR